MPMKISGKTVIILSLHEVIMARARARVCVCVCERERERARERERDALCLIGSSVMLNCAWLEVPII